MAPSGSGRSVVDVEPLMTASRIINAVIVKSLASVDAGLTVPQLRVLVILGSRDRASLSQVAAALGVNPSNASRTCEQLVRRGLVVRGTDPADRRRVALKLAGLGSRMLDRVMADRRVLLEGIVADLPARDQRALMSALQRFNASAETFSDADAPRSGSRTRLDPWFV